MPFENDPTLANPIISAVKKRKAEEEKVEAERIWNELEPTGQRLMECAAEPGASAWLNALPVDEHGFCFRDALSLRYGWPIPNITSKCACGTNFLVDHAMICHRGGIPTLRHNEIRDLTAELLAETSSDVSTEPRLQPMHDEVLQL